MNTYVFDIDGTICNNTYGDYEKAVPFLDRIEVINNMYDNGKIIKFFTARGSTTGIDWRETTEKQLKLWGLKYHELILGKPDGNFFIDDKGYNSENWEWFKEQSHNNFTNSKHKIIKYLSDSSQVIYNCISNDLLIQKVIKLSRLIENSIKEGGKLILAGNGGSFADAQHIAAEYVSRMKSDRIPLPAIALGTNSSNTTAIANDFGYENIFSRELECLGCKKDVLIAFTTSGNSQNIINLVEKAKTMSLNFFVLTGLSGGKCSVYKKNIINVPSRDTAVIQQMHITLGHLICSLSEEKFINK